MRHHLFLYAERHFSNEAPFIPLRGAIFSNEAPFIPLRGAIFSNEAPLFPLRGATDAVR
jgi:hypothetical protein